MGAQFLNFWCYVACSLWDVWCAKNSKYPWKKCLRSNVEAFCQPERESNIIKIHLGCILGLSCVMSGSSWGFCLAIYDFVGLILGHFGPMFGPTTYLAVGGLYVGLILGHFKAMLGLTGVMCVKKNAFFLHGSSIFEFLVLCCMPPLGCVMCKKHCKYREKIAFGAM